MRWTSFAREQSLAWGFDRERCGFGCASSASFLSLPPILPLMILQLPLLLSLLWTLSSVVYWQQLEMSLPPLPPLPLGLPPSPLRQGRERPFETV